MTKRALENGIKFKYVLTDSWFSSYDFIKDICELKDKSIHVVCGMKKDIRKYYYKGEKLNDNELLKHIQSKEKAKCNRKNNVRYYEVIVEYNEIGKVKLFFTKGTHQRNWKLVLSTDLSLNFNGFVEVYSIRWAIEVIFKECKTYLKLGKCQAHNFIAQIADISMCYILYNILIYTKRIGDYKTTGPLFEYIGQDLREKSVAEKIYFLMKDLLEIILEEISFEDFEISLKETVKDNKLFKYIMDKFESSFLGVSFKEIQSS